MSTAPSMSDVHDPRETPDDQRLEGIVQKAERRWRADDVIELVRRYRLASVARERQPIHRRELRKMQTALLEKNQQIAHLIERIENLKAGLD